MNLQKLDFKVVNPEINGPVDKTSSIMKWIPPFHSLQDTEPVNSYMWKLQDTGATFGSALQVLIVITEIYQTNNELFITLF